MTVSSINDKLFIVFVFLNTFAFNLSFWGIELRYVILLLLFFITLLTKQGRCLYRNSLFYLLLLLFGYTLLFIYSLCRGNTFDNIIPFLMPLLMVLQIGPISLLISEYGLNRYIVCFCISVSLLLVYFLYIHLLAVTNPNAAFDLIDSNSLVILTVLDGIPRVVIKTFVFVVPLFAYLLLFIKNRELRYILVVICFFVVILSQTYGILLGILGVYLIYKYILNQKVQLIVILLLFLMTCMYIIWGTDFLDEEKMGSIDLKIEQITNALSSVGLAAFLFGDGIGALISLDSRGKMDIMIEVAPIMLFKIGGIIFSLVLLLAYFFPCIPPLFRKNVDRKLLWLSLSQVGIISTSFSNPYIWSGGVGLFMPMMILAYYDSVNRK